MNAALSAYARSFPAAAPADAHWTERTVKQGHADYCAAYGHASWTEDGHTVPWCPRCGESMDASAAAAALSMETDAYVSPADIATPAPCTHWECALMGDRCAETGTPAPVCHVAGCEATPTHTDPASSAAGLAPYVCRAHYVPGVHVFAAPRVYHAMLTAYEYTLLIASGDLTRENALTAALTRDALLTDAERAERHAVSRDRYATRYHGTDWHTLTGRPA